MKKIIFGLAGEIACGKGTFAKYIVDRYDGNSYRFSTMMRDMLHVVHLPETRFNVQEISIIMRRSFGEDVFSKAMRKEIEKDEHGIIALDGIRREKDMEFLSQLAGFRLVYVEADVKKRYERIKLSGENVYDINKSYEEFLKDHEREPEQRIRALKSKAQYIIDNNDSLSAYHQQIDELVRREFS